MSSLILHRIRLLIILICLFPSNVYATTTSAGMNVSGQGSNYIFIYRGNNPALYDYLIANDPTGWTAVCNTNEQCGDQYLTISAWTINQTDYLFLYTVDSEGNVSYPLSGSWYYFTNEPWPPAPTPVYGSSGPTPSQQARMDAKLALANAGQGSTIEANVTGDANSIYITQAGNPSYINLMILGNTNTFNSTQNMDVGVHAYNETTIIGNSNDVDIIQQGSGMKSAFIDITGDNNTANINQKDSGEHYIQLDITGQDHVASILQEGSGNHDATVALDGTQPWNFDLTQSGPTSQTYTLPHNMSDGSNVSGSCYAVGGCNLTINQN